MNLFAWTEKPLRTVWRVERDGRASLLVGTAHFSPYSFKKALTNLVQEADAVCFEGPLDPESMAAVARYGRQGGGTPSVYDALSPALVRKINGHMAALRPGPASMAGSGLDLLYRSSAGFLEQNARGVRPWMAFFATWSAFLNWKHSMDLEAFDIAGRLGKKIRYLETIQDQLQALDGIPFERIVNYFHRFQHWSAHRALFRSVYVEGKTRNFLSVTEEFPTRCESIIARRDPVFFEGIRTSFDAARTTAFVGIGHIPGIRQRLIDAGYRVHQEGS